MSLCEKCQHRADSRARVAEFQLINMDRIAAGEPVRVCDPAPKYECKLHDGYGGPNESRERRDDYKEKASE